MKRSSKGTLTTNAKEGAVKKKIPVKVFEEIKPRTVIDAVEKAKGEIVREGDRVYLVTTI